MASVEFHPADLRATLTKTWEAHFAGCAHGSEVEVNQQGDAVEQEYRSRYVRHMEEEARLQENEDLWQDYLDRPCTHQVSLTLSSLTPSSLTLIGLPG